MFRSGIFNWFLIAIAAVVGMAVGRRLTNAVGLS